jgi:CDP-diacylglycerol--glycerol-3-phosphate 3-phosphatidyltransferase
MIRIFLVPLILVFIFLAEAWEYSPFIALFVYLLGVLTDTVDGQFARKTKTVTSLGKFLDPISDKIFVNGIMIALIFAGVFFEKGAVLHYVNLTCITVMLPREFAISAIRQVAADKRVIIAADKYGKIKTVLTFISFGFFILWLYKGPDGYAAVREAFYYCGLVLFYAATALSIISGINYYVKNIESLRF